MFQKIKKITVPLITIPVLLIVSACNSGITGIAPSTTPITGKDTYTVIGPASGKSVGMEILFIPIHEYDPSKIARDRAIESSGGNALIEVTEDLHMMNFFFIFCIFWTKVEGTAVQLERGGAQK